MTLNTLFERYMATRELADTTRVAKDKSIEVDGYSGVVFTAKSGRPLMPNGVNSVLYNIVDAYNKVEVERAKKEHRKAELLPKFSAHVMRHTACTRMAECAVWT